MLHKKTFLSSLIAKMSAPKSSDSPAPAFKRRNVLMVLAAGACATVVGARRFFSPSGAPAPTTAATATKKSATGKTADAPEPAAEESVYASGPNVPDQLTRDWFLPHLESRFSMSLKGDHTLDMPLVEISPETRINNGAKIYSAFTLLFDAPQGTPSADGIYHIRHPQLGEMDLFLSPVGHTVTKVQYEAAFTRLV